MRTKDYDKQQRIKEAMVRLILKEGLNGASVSKIAKEANVSPATIYVYYSSKEEMFAEVYRECSHHSYHFLMHRVSPDMNGAELIETLVHSFYDYTIKHEEIFSFVEQCSHCPTLSEYASDEDCGCEMFDLIHTYQERGMIRRYSDPNLAAVLFAPVRHIALNQNKYQVSANTLLQELTEMLKELLLV